MSHYSRVMTDLMLLMQRLESGPPRVLPVSAGSLNDDNAQRWE